MKKNVGGIDRILRIALGVVLVGGNLINYYVLHNPYWVWSNIGWIFILTGFIRVCPIYSIFGLSTCKKTS